MEFKRPAGQWFFDAVRKFKRRGAGDEKLFIGKIFHQDFDGEPDIFHALSFVDDNQFGRAQEAGQFGRGFIGQALADVDFVTVQIQAGYINYGADMFDQGGFAGLPGSIEDNGFFLKQFVLNGFLEGSCNVRHIYLLFNIN